MHSKFITAVSFVLIILPGIGCSSKNTSPSQAKVTVLKKYQTIVSYKDDILAKPTFIRYDGKSHLFIYDGHKHQVLELDDHGKVLRTYGQGGRGPGEFLMVNNIFLTKTHLYVVDGMQYKISRFTLDGKLDGTMNFGEEGTHAMPPPAPPSLEVRSKDINNKPFVTQKGNVLLSNITPHGEFQKLYSLIDWKGNTISDMGEIPKGSTFTMDYDKYHESIDDHKIPAYYKPHAFPIEDKANTGAFYLIYNAYPKIEKYNRSGQKLWGTNISKTSELDSVTAQFYHKSNKILERGKGRIGLKKYVTGTSGPNGYLYLALGKYYFKNPPHRLWIHEFNNKGKLIRRYKLVSKNVNLAAIFDIDFAHRRIFVVTGNAAIRAYPF